MSNELASAGSMTNHQTVDEEVPAREVTPQRILEEQGYLIATSLYTYRIGEVIAKLARTHSTQEVPGPLVVVAKATAAEYAAQMVRYFRHPGHPGLFFYKVVAE